MNPFLYVDFYKPSHYPMYPEGMTQLYSNLTARGSRMYRADGTLVDKVVFFGLQHFCLDYLIDKFNKEFFWISWQVIEEEYKRHVNVDTTHVKALHELGFLPIEIKALDEGTLCPVGVPMLTIQISDPSKYGQHAWVVNYLETLMSCMLWQPITSATIAHEYKKVFKKNAEETGVPMDLIQWQGHDFSMRGMSSVESAILSGMGHLLSFTGTDTIPAIYQLEDSYAANGLIGASVPATEHSVMCMGTKEDEIKTFERLLDLYPTGILSVVSDTWDLWKVCTEYLPALKDKIKARDGKLVIRPDSGNIVDIICGLNTNPASILHTDNPAGKGVIELLGDVFGYTINEKGLKVLPPYINMIYGDSVTLAVQSEIFKRLKAKGWAYTGVLGIGSFTYQYNTRDTFKMAVKATYGEITHQTPHGGDFGGVEPKSWVEPREIFKDPITDDGSKKSKKGLLMVHDSHGMSEMYEGPYLLVKDQCTKEEEQQGLLTTVFKDGKMVKTTTLEEIRTKLNSYL